MMSTWRKSSRHDPLGSGKSARCIRGLGRMEPVAAFNALRCDSMELPVACGRPPVDQAANSF
jgi:hypothetical protein